MSESEPDTDLIERRKTWKTVSFGGITTYGAFSLGGKLLMGDVARIRRHKDALLRGDVGEICEQVWNDIFVSPNVSEMLAMYERDVNALIDVVAIPHTYVFGYKGPSIHQIERINQGLGTVPSADEFIRSMRALSMTDTAGETINNLARLNNRECFEQMLGGKVNLIPEDFRNYKRQKRNGSSTEEVLFLPSWVRHRLAHPENSYERRFPDAGDYGRSTYLLSAITLILLYERQEPVFNGLKYV